MNVFIYILKMGVAWVANAHDESYDLIIVDSTDPIGPGEGLFSTVFYENCYRILSKDGILVNQNESPYFNQNAHEMKRAHEKINRIFPIAKVYQAHIQRIHRDIGYLDLLQKHLIRFKMQNSMNGKH